MTLTAHVQLRQQHMCSISGCMFAVLDSDMDPARKVIADWLERHMERLNWTPQRWATAANTSPTNITRALKPDEKPVMTFKTQQILAHAAGVPSALDYLAAMETTVETREVLSATTLQLALVEVLRQSAGVEIPGPAARPTAEALRLCLQLLEENPAIHDNEDAIKVLVRAATSRPREARPEE